MSENQAKVERRWPTTMKEEHWEKLWDVRDIGFHQNQVHSDLRKHENFLKPNCRVYVPLCGKTIDLVYLADQGHEVVGSELVERAVKEFFDEQKLEYSVAKDKVTDIPVYRAFSKNIRIYQGDFFALTSIAIGKFDAIWDRASIVAINKEDRIKFANVLKELMTPTCKSLINILKITGKNYVGPPHSMNKNDVENLFGDACEIQEIEATQVPFDHPTVESIKQINLLLSKK